MQEISHFSVNLNTLEKIITGHKFSKNVEKEIKLWLKEKNLDLEEMYKNYIFYFLGRYYLTEDGFFNNEAEFIGEGYPHKILKIMEED